MNCIALGSRNLLKHRRRSLTTVLTISIGFACLLASKGYSNYCLWGLRESIINGGVGHFQIRSKGNFSRSSDDLGESLIEDYRSLIFEISALRGVKFAAPMLSFGGTISSGKNMAPIMAHGGWIDEERSLTSFSTIESGSFPSEGSAYGILLGVGAAGIAALEPGDDCVITAPAGGSAINAIDCEVSGLLSNQLEEMEDAYAFIPLATAQELLEAGDSANSLIVMLKASADAKSVEEGIAKICGRRGLEYRSWDELVPYYSGAASFYSSSMDIALAVIMAVVFFSIVNTMLMTVFERMREIGTIRALGTGRRKLLNMLLAEALLLGAAGFVCGICLALAAAAAVNALGGIPLPPPPGNSRAYSGLVSLSLRDVLAYGSVLLPLSGLSALYPAWKAARMPISENLRWI